MEIGIESIDSIDFYILSDLPTQILSKHAPDQLDSEQLSPPLIPDTHPRPLSYLDTTRPAQPYRIMTNSILGLCPHLQTHLRLSQLSDPLLLQQTSKCTIQGAPQSTKFHHTNLYSYAFLTHYNIPGSVAKINKNLDAAQWKQAMDIEYQSLIHNRTWILVDLPPNKSLINTKWMFQCKFSFDGFL